MKSEITRSYEVLLSPHRQSAGCEAAELLDQNLVFYNHGYVVFMDIMASLIGGYEPSMNLYTPFSKQLCDKKEEEEDQLTMPPREVFAFCCWFRLETRSPAVAFQVGVRQMRQRFEKYWGSRPYDKSLIESLISLAIRDEESGESVWVDRRKAFEKLNRSLLMESQDIADFLAAPDFPLSTKTSSPSYGRGLLTALWGEGKKTDAALYVALKNLLEHGKWEGWKRESPQEVAEAMYSMLGKSDEDHTAADGIMRAISDGRTGREPVHSLRMKEFLKTESRKPQEEKIEEIRAALTEWVKKNATKFSRPLGARPWAANLLPLIEMKLEQKYREPRVKQNEWGEMLSVAWAHIRAHHSLVVNALVDRKIAEKELTATCDEYEMYDGIVHRFEKEPDHHPDYLFRPKQAGGMVEFIKTARAMDRSLEDETIQDAIAVVQQNEKVRVSTGFLTWLCNKEKALILSDRSPQEIEKGFKTVGLRHQGEQDLAKLLMPRISFPDPIVAPEWPQFGNNRGNVRLVPVEIEQHFRYHRKHTNDKFGVGQSKGKNHKVLGFLDIELFDAQGDLRTVRIPTMGKRALREVFYSVDSERTLPRNHDLLRAKVGLDGQVVSPHDQFNASVGVKLIRGKTPWNQSGQHRWYAKLSVRLPGSNVEKVALQKGDRVLAIDVGVRAWASYAILEITDERYGIPVYYDGKPEAYTRVMATGHISHIGTKGRDILNDGGDDPQPTDINSARSFLADLGNFLPEKQNKRLEQWNGSLNSLYSLLAKRWKSALWHARAMTPHLRRLFDKLEKKAAATPASYAGGLTMERLGLQIVLNECRRAILGKMRKDGEDDPALETQANTMLTKIRHLKQERIRLTVHEIIQLCLSTGCKAIVAENLEKLRTDDSKPKFVNRMLMNWAPQRTYDQLVDQCKMHGIRLLPVSARNSSHYDFADDNQWKPRLQKVTGRLLRETYWQNYFARHRRLGKQKGKKLGYTPEVLKFLAEIGDTKSLPDNAEVLVPKSGGWFYLSKGFPEAMPADETAACQIGCRGIPYLVGERADGGKKAGTARKAQKPKPAKT